MSSVVARPEVVMKFCTKHGRNGGIFVESTVAAGTVVLSERLWGEMFSYPMRVSGLAVVGRCVRRSEIYVGNGRGKAIFEHAGWIDWCSGKAGSW